MVDIRLLYPLEKAEAADRLAEAISAAGYRVEREPLADGRAFPDVAAEAGRAKVVLLVWSRGLVSAAMEGTRLALARRHPNLIEISADGIEPAAGVEASPVVLLCGWRGQPFHPGWQRILAEIKRLCGSREAPGKRAPPVASSDPVRAAAGASASRRPPVRAAVAAGALVAAILGAGILYERAGGDSAPEPRRAVAAAGEAPRSPSADAPAAAVPPAPAAMAAQAPPDALPPASAPAPATAVAAASAERTAPVRPAATQERSRRERVAAASSGEVKRYSRKNSKTMRLFCQRSGRSTPQCRTFERSMRDLDG